ncbi:hypothetical protein CTI12_AA578960 [Artemisia annua]|uniref:Uncharacterized protein n=1 Tax=Artemisia annua TaxID=35608 RepID=A0A2U1KF63_ARTAN|nr:hypothetical protein CTI12_AA578960 [Artemisia annua]
MAEKKSTFDAVHNAQMDQSRIKWAKMMALIDDVIDHTPEWSDEGSDEPLKFTELWLSRIHEIHKFNNLLNAMKKEVREEVDMLEYKIKVEKVCPIKAWEDFNQALDSNLVKLTVGAVNVPRVKDEVVAVAAVGDEVADVEEVEGNGRPLKRKRVYAADKNDLGKDGWFCV